MPLFEFLTVAVSIVLGLGLVRLMDGLGGVLRSPSRYWIHLAVLLGLIACHLRRKRAGSARHGFGALLEGALLSRAPLALPRDRLLRGATGPGARGHAG